MDFPEEYEWPERWWVVCVVIILSWALSFLSILSWLIPPLLGFTLVRAFRRGAWRPMLLLLVANPLAVFFIGGLVDYYRGAPALRSMGLHSTEFYNIDRNTRCFRQTGGCLVDGDEWVSQDFHNLGVLALVAVFGPPSRSYDGPYPSKEEATKFVSTTPKLNVPGFLKGRIPKGDQPIQLDPVMVEKLLLQMGSFLSVDHQFDEDSANSYAQAAVFQERCLILRVVVDDELTGRMDSEHQDFVVLIDSKNLRPFAYYRNKGDFMGRRPAWQYLPELSR